MFSLRFEIYRSFLESFKSNTPYIRVQTIGRIRSE